MPKPRKNDLTEETLAMFAPKSRKNGITEEELAETLARLDEALTGSDEIPKDVYETPEDFLDILKNSDSIFSEPTVAEKTLKLLKNTLRNIKNKMKKMPSKVSKKLKPLADGISESIKNAEKKATELKKAASKKAKALKDAAKKKADTLKKSVKESRAYKLGKLAPKPFATKTSALKDSGGNSGDYNKLAAVLKNMEKNFLDASVTCKELKDITKSIVKLYAEYDKALGKEETEKANKIITNKIDPLKEQFINKKSTLESLAKDYREQLKPNFDNYKGNHFQEQQTVKSVQD